MNIINRIALALVGSTLVLSVAPTFANDYPSQPIKIVVPYGAGGTTDISARQLATLAEEKLGQPIVVENLPGGSGTNAMRSVAAAKPDGYTLIAATSSPSFVTTGRPTQRKGSPSVGLGKSASA